MLSIDKKTKFFILFSSATLTLSSKGSSKTLLLAKEGFFEVLELGRLEAGDKWFLGSLDPSIFLLLLCHMFIIYYLLFFSAYIAISAL